MLLSAIQFSFSPWKIPNGEILLAPQSNTLPMTLAVPSSHVHPNQILATYEPVVKRHFLKVGFGGETISGFLCATQFAIVMLIRKNDANQQN